MIANYTRPQLLVRQELEVYIPSTERTLHAFVPGPQYDLFRYTNAAERASKVGVLFVPNSSTDEADRQLVPYEGLRSQHLVDQTYVRLYGENLEGQVFAAESPEAQTDLNPYVFQIGSLLSPDVITVTRRPAVLKVTHPDVVEVLFGGSGYPPNGSVDQPIISSTGSGGMVRMTANSSGVITSAVVAAPGLLYGAASTTFEATEGQTKANVGRIPDANYATPLLAELYNRPIKPGDVLYASLGGQTVRRVVKEIRRATQPSSFGTNTAKSDKRFAAASSNPIRSDSADFGNTTAPLGWATRLAKGAILGLDITEPGDGYSSGTTLAVSAPITIDSGGLVYPGAAAVLAPVITEGRLTGVNVEVPGAGYYYNGVVGVTVTNAGSGYESGNPPRLVVVTPTNGEACQLEPVIEDGYLIGAKIINPGYGHAASNAVSVIGGAGSGAELRTVINRGSIVDVVITNPGSGYDAGATVVGPAGGSGFVGKAWFGAVSATPTAAGSNYSYGDIVEVDTGTPFAGRKIHLRVTGVQLVSGAVTSLEVVEGHEGWLDGTQPLPFTGIDTTTAITGSGTGLTVALELGVTKVTVVSPGTLYSSADTAITFTPVGNGSGTVATAVIREPVTVTITDPAGTGTGATFTPKLRAVPSDWDGLVEGSIYSNRYGERYIVTVTKSGSGQSEAEVKIRSSSGAFSANSVKAFHYGLDYLIMDPALGGLVLALTPPDASVPLRAGDVFTAVVHGAYLPLELNESGRVLAASIIMPGSGYTNGTYELVVADPPAGGRRARVRATVTTGLWQSDSLTVLDPGEGYVYAPLLLPPAASMASGGDGVWFESSIGTAENSRDLAAVQSGVYTGPRATRYQLRVLRGTDLDQSEESFSGAIVQVSDTAGVDEVQRYTITHGQQYPLGTYGLKFMFPADQATPSGVIGGTTASGTAVLDDGEITAVTFASEADRGSGYTVPPTVIFSGNGTGASAVAVVHQGKVIGIEILNGGTGYTSADVIISAPTGYQGGLRTGDVYVLDAVPEQATGDYNAIQLYGQAADITNWTETDLLTNVLDVDVRTLYSGLIQPQRHDPPNLAWEAGTAAVGGIRVAPDLMLELLDRADGHTWVPVKASPNGRLFSHWRGLIPATSADRIRLYDSEEAIIAAFGLKDMDNPLCYAGCMALLGGQGKPVYMGRLASDTAGGHAQLIRAAEHVDGIYAIALPSNDLAIKNLWAAHVSKMSLENWKLWRRLYVGAESPGAYDVMATQADGTDFVATITASASGNVRVLCPVGGFLTRSIRPGDQFRTNYSYDAWGNPAFDTYIVQTVNADDELILETGPSVPVAIPARFEVWRPDTGLAQAEHVGQQSDSFQNRRVCNVWCDHPQLTDADGVVQPVPTYYLAAEVAGLRAAVLPQQGLTYTELQHSVDAAPTMFTKFSEEELNVAAQNGTWIVIQEQEDGPMFIRHQLTTNSGQGILYYEDSIGANMDNIAYAVAALFQPYVGKRNVNVETLEEMETKLRGTLDLFKQDPGGLSSIGPALLNWSEVSVTIDPVLKDRINTRVRLELPTPINSIFVILTGTTASDATIATINLTVNSANVTTG